MECHTEGTELPSAGKGSHECKVPGFGPSSQRFWESGYSCREFLAYYSRRGEHSTAVKIVTAMLGVAAAILLFATIVYIIPHIHHGLHVFHQENGLHVFHQETINNTSSTSKQEESTTPSSYFDVEIAHRRLTDDTEGDVEIQSATWEASEIHTFNNNNSYDSGIWYNDSNSAFSAESA
jgi:hypothetical protein